MMNALTMGAYGPYVWSCFALTLIVLVICTIQAKRRHTYIYKVIRTRLRAMDTEK
jgi:heme exporter protein CcmD